MYCLLERSLGRPMRTWIFQGNPNKFDIDGYLAVGTSEITWLVRQYSSEIKPGDVVYIWRSSGGSKGKAAVSSLEGPSSLSPITLRMTLLPLPSGCAMFRPERVPA